MSVIKITKQNFGSEVADSKNVVLVDFWAPWCGPCRMLGPVIEEVAKEAGEGVTIGKINVDEEEDLASSFGVFTIPTVLVFKNGKVVNKSVGYRPKADIMRLLNV